MDITKNIESSNTWLKVNRPTNHKDITLLDVQKRLKLGNFLTVENAKTIKGEELGYLTGILYLAPHKITGFNFCTMAVNCIKDCLFHAGHGQVTSTTRSRIIKTLAYLMDKKEFISHINKDITRLEKKALKRDLTPAIRLNGTTDLNIGSIYSDVMKKFNHIQFYDYTKVPYFVENNKHTNYHITFSCDGLNIDKSIELMTKGYNSAIVFFDSNFPKVYKGFTVVNGDAHDLRFLDKKNSAVGLRYKGTGIKNADLDFVVKV